MIDLALKAFSWLADLVGSLLRRFIMWVLGFFPDGDATVLSTIDGWFSNVVPGGLTFNLYYFVDFAAVFVVTSVILSVLLCVYGIAFVRWLIRVLHDLIDSIPVIG